MTVNKALLLVSALALPTGAWAQATAPAPAPAPATAATPGATTPTTTAADSQATASTPAGQVVAATATDFKVGAMVHDQKGGMVGKIEAIEGADAVVATGKVRAKIPQGSFGKSGDTLVLGLTKAELEAQAGGNTPS